MTNLIRRLKKLEEQIRPDAEHIILDADVLRLYE
jgi:hypothetical protein